MNWRLSSLRTELWLFAGAFAIRALYALAVEVTSGSHGFISFSDAEYFYFAAAKNLLAHHAFSIAQSAPYYPDAYHTPLYPLFVSILFWLHLPLLGVILVQDVLAAITVVLIYRMALELTDSHLIAITAAIFAALEPMSIYWSGLLMSDTFFAFLSILSFYLLSRDRFIGASIVLGLAVLVRPIALFFLPVYIVFVLYEAHARNWKWRESLRIAAAVLVSFAVVVSPWLARNKILFNTWSFTSAGWYDLYVESISPFALHNGIPLPSVNAGTDVTRFSFAYTPEFKNADLSVIKQNPVDYASFQIGRSAWSLISNRYEYFINVVFKTELPSLYSRIPAAFIMTFLVVGELFWLTIYALVLLAVINKKTLPWWFFFSSMIVINALISGGINPGGTDMSRYSLPFYIFFFTFAGIGFRQLSAAFAHFTNLASLNSSTSL